jgi:hypothetical protein
MDQVELNPERHDAIVPVLRSLQHVYSKPDLTKTIMQLIGRDINGQTSTARRRRSEVETAWNAPPAVNSLTTVRKPSTKQLARNPHLRTRTGSSHGT